MKNIQKDFKKVNNEKGMWKVSQEQKGRRHERKDKAA